MWSDSDSPAATLVREANPSIPGLRYFVAGSIRTVVLSQSRVPVSSFSWRIASRDAGAAASWAFTQREEKAAPTPAMSVDSSTSRRLILRGLDIGKSPRSPLGQISAISETGRES
jgi:hypothetical protein